MLQDALRGKNLKKAAIHRAKQSGVNLLKRIAAPPPPGEPVQSPLKRKRKRQSTIKRSKKSSTRSKDIFGYMASLIHPASCKGLKSKLDLFALPATQTSVDHGRVVKHRPASILSENSPVDR